MVERERIRAAYLPVLTVGFFQQNFDTWTAFVIFVQFISPILHDELQERRDGSRTAHSSVIISNNTLNVL